MVTPAPGSTLTATTVEFRWTGGVGVVEYYLAVGTTPGGSDLYYQSHGTSLRGTVPNLPADGSTLYVRLWQRTGATWQSRQLDDYSYTAATGGPSRAELVAPWAAFTGPTTDFQWTGGIGATQYYLSVGTTVGGADLAYLDGGTNLSMTVTGMPTSGPVYVRLWSRIGVWASNYRDYKFAAGRGRVLLAEMTAPPPSSTLADSTVEFQWTRGFGADQYYLSVGTSVRGYDLAYLDEGVNSRDTITNLPVDGSTIYVTLWSHTSSGWQAHDYTYTAAPAVADLAEMIAPAASSTLRGGSPEFRWTGGVAVDHYYLSVGTTAGGHDLAYLDEGTNLSTTVPNLPTNGSTVYVRLWSHTSSGWHPRDYTYTAVSGGPTPASLVGPVPSTALTASTVEFEWAGGIGASQYYIGMGTTVGGLDIAYKDGGTGARTTITNLPTNGSPVYVRLWSKLGTSWQHYIDYKFTATNTSSALAELTSPPPSSTLTASTVDFRWTGGANVAKYFLYVGTTPGGSDLASVDVGTNLSQTVANLPTDGSTVYVTLWSRLSSGWQFNAYTYTAE